MVPIFSYSFKQKTSIFSKMCNYIFKDLWICIFGLKLSQSSQQLTSPERLIVIVCVRHHWLLRSSQKLDWRYINKWLNEMGICVAWQKWGLQSHGRCVCGLRRERFHSRDLYTTNQRIRCFILSCVIKLKVLPSMHWYMEELNNWDFFCSSSFWLHLIINLNSPSCVSW